MREAFQLGDGPFPAGALTLRARGRDPGAASWARADPVHLRLMRDRAVAPGEAFGISSEEAVQLCDALNRISPARISTPVDALACVRAHRAGSDRRSTRPAKSLTCDEKARRSSPKSRWCCTRTRSAARGARRARGQQRVVVGRRSRRQRALRMAVGSRGRSGGHRRGAPRRRAPSTVAALGRGVDRAPAEEGGHAVLDALRAPLALEQDVNEKIAAFERDWFAPLLGALRAGVSAW